MRELRVITINRPGMQAAFSLAEKLSGMHSGGGAKYRLTIYAKANERNEMTDARLDRSDRTDIVLFENLDDLLAGLWNKGDALLFFLATGIVVRKIAPLLGSKFEDPAILVMDFRLRQILPLLSGHAGGANDIATDLSSRIPGCETFLTTATDQTGTFAFDLFALKNGFDIENVEMVARISNALLNGERVTVFSPPALFPEIRSFPGFSQTHMRLEDLALPGSGNRTERQEEPDSSPGPSVCLSPSPVPVKDCLRIRIRPIAIGCGMNRGVSADDIERAVSGFLREHHLRVEDVKCVASFTAKENEPGLRQFATGQSLPLVFFDERQINEAPGAFSESMAERYFAIQGVAEPCAVLASERGILFKTKQAYGGVTVAAAF